MGKKQSDDHSSRRGFLTIGGLSAAGLLASQAMQPTAAYAAGEVSSVNGKIGDVTLTSADVGAAPATEGDPTTIVAHPTRFAGIDPTGATPSHTGLQLAINATPEGGLLIIPAGRYLLNDGLSVGAEKSIGVTAHGATVIQNSANPIFNVGGSYSSAVGVQSISNQNVTSSTGTVTSTTVITTASAQPWERGDVLKLVSDDLIPSARPGTGGVEARIGEFVVVRQVSGTTITLASRVRELYETNIRVAKISQKTFSLEGGSYETAPAGLTSNYGSLFFFYRLQNPTVSRITVRQASSIVLGFASCFGYSVHDVDISGAVDRPGNGQVGYAVHDSASSFGRVIGGVFRHVRHAFTDDSPRVAADTALLTSYGRSFGAHIIGASAIGTTSNAWDTHHSSEGIEFIACTATGGVGEEDGNIAGFALRGKNHRVSNCTVRNMAMGAIVFTESGGGESYGHVITDLVVRNVASYALWLNIHPDGHPKAKVRDTQENVNVSGLIATGCPRFVGATNAVAAIHNSVFLVDPGSDDVNYDGIVTKNSSLSITNVLLDYEANTKGVPRPIISTSSAGFTPGTQETRFSGIEIRSTSSTASRATRALNGGSHKMTGRNLTFTYPFSIMPGDRTTDSVLQWECTAGSAVANGDLNSSYVYISGTDLQTPLDRALQSADLHVMIRGVLGVANQTTKAFPAGKTRGQVITMWMAENSSGSLTVKNGSSFRTILVGGADKVLRKSGQLRLIWDGTLWRELV
jgi:hypothetical protein